MSNSHVQSSYWTGLFYPQDNGDILEFISNCKLSGFEMVFSPLHSPDEVSHFKEHYHFVYRRRSCHESTARNDLIRCLPCGSLPLLLKVNSVNGICRYLVHLDDKDKQQFNSVDECTIINNFPVNFDKVISNKEVLLSSRSEVLSIIRDIKITNFCDLVSFCLDNERNDLLDYIEKRAYFIEQILKSMRCSK